MPTPTPSPATPGPQNAATTSAAPAPTAAVPPTLKRRLLCMVYEGLLLFAVVFIAAYLFDTLTQSRNPERLRHLRQAWLFVMLGVYFVWFWTHSGQTLAMKTWRIRVTDLAGQPLGYGRAIWRYVLSWMFLLPALAVAQVLELHGWQALGLALVALFVPPFAMRWDADGQFLHDRLARTRLIAT